MLDLDRLKHRTKSGDLPEYFESIFQPAINPVAHCLNLYKRVNRIHIHNNNEKTTMRYLTKAILFILIIFIPENAIQDKPTVDKRLGHLQQELTLTEAQTEQIRLILQNEESELNKVRELNKDDRRAVNQARKSQKKQTDQQIMNVLAGDQKKTFSAMKERRADDPRLRELKEKLQLSEEQVEQIAPIMSNTREEMETLRSESGGDRREMRDKMRGIRDRQNKQIEEFLTEDQKKIFAEMKNERKKRGPRGGKGGRPGGQR